MVFRQNVRWHNLAIEMGMHVGHRAVVMAVARLILYRSAAVVDGVDDMVLDKETEAYGRRSNGRTVPSMASISASETARCAERIASMTNTRFGGRLHPATFESCLRLAAARHMFVIHIVRLHNPCAYIFHTVFAKSPLRHSTAPPLLPPSASVGGGLGKGLYKCNTFPIKKPRSGHSFTY